MGISIFMKYSLKALMLLVGDVVSKRTSQNRTDVEANSLAWPVRNVRRVGTVRTVKLLMLPFKLVTNAGYYLHQIL